MYRRKMCQQKTGDKPNGKIIISKKISFQTFLYAKNKRTQKE
jgi:hypothetical protein